jgi:hypothetical protein
MEDRTQVISTIKSLSKRLRVMTLIVLIGTWAVFALVVEFNGVATLLPVPKNMAVDLSILSSFSLALVYMLAAIKPAAFIPVLYFLYKLFALCQEGWVFTSENIKFIRYIGFSLMAIDLIFILQSALAGPVLSWLGAVEPYFSLDLAISYLIIGFFVELISRIIDLGRQLQDYQELVV